MSPTTRQRSGIPRVGILGGGQLAKMMAQVARRMGIEVGILDPDPAAPALALAHRTFLAPYTDLAALRALAASSDVVTFDLENVEVGPLEILENEGFRVRPRPHLLATIQDKLRQKQMMVAHEIPTSDFAEAHGSDVASLGQLGYPVFQKVRRAGYDGRGVCRLDGPSSLPRALPGPSLIERPVELVKELAVLIARRDDGTTQVYEPVEMVFDSATHRLDHLVAPGGRRVPEATRAIDLALRVAGAFEIVGVLAVEMFLSTNGDLLVNELAPRPHNSGHHTIEACVTSQFEQHLRAVLDLPLGEARQLSPAATANLVGDPAGDGPPALIGLDRVLALPSVHLHLYGKSRTRMGRKMGHVTALHDHPDEAVRLALAARDALRIVPEGFVT